MTVFDSREDRLFSRQQSRGERNTRAFAVSGSGGSVGTSGGDPFWSSVVLLVGNNNGPNTSTTIIDQSLVGNTVSVFGDLQWSTTAPPTGLTSTLLFDGTGDWATVLDSAAFTFGSGNLTVEAYVNFSETASTHYIASQWGNDTSWQLDRLGGSLRFTTVGTGGTQGVTSAWTPTIGTWYHVSAVRDSNTIRIYVDGIQLNSAACSGTLTDSSRPPCIGVSEDGANSKVNPFQGKMVMRITKGVCRYPSGTTYVVPTLPFPSS